MEGLLSTGPTPSSFGIGATYYPHRLRDALSPVCRIFYKVVELVGGGCVINGAYPV